MDGSPERMQWTLLVRKLYEKDRCILTVVRVGVEIGCFGTSVGMLILGFIADLRYLVFDMTTGGLCYSRRFYFKCVATSKTTRIPSK